MYIACVIRGGQPMSMSRPDMYRMTVVDDDPLRARREVRELLEELLPTDPDAALDLPDAGSGRPPREGDKGGAVVDAVGLLLSAGSFGAAVIQVWLARVPQRTIVITRPDGVTLQITGKEARADDVRIARFLGDQDQDGLGVAAADGAAEIVEGPADARTVGD